MADLPFIKFYPSDWLGSTKLRGVSLAAKGVWIDLLAIMWECTPRGTLTVNGRPLTVQEAATRVHGPTKHVVKAIEELLAQGVAERRSDGTIYSARMVRDAQIHEVRAEAGSRGGLKTQTKTPSLLKQTGKQTSSKPDAEPGDFAQPSEARSQNPETRAAAEAVDPAAAAAGSGDMEDQALRALLITAGIGEPTLGELAALGISVQKAAAVIGAAKRAGKGTGVMVLNLRDEAGRESAKKATRQQQQGARAEWEAFWRQCTRDEAAMLRGEFCRQFPAFRDYTGGVLDDLPRFREWAMQFDRTHRGWQSSWREATA